MRLYTMTRPSTPLTLVCAPSALSPAPASSAVPVGAERVVIPAQAVGAAPAAERAAVLRAHQVQDQAELAQALTRIDKNNSIVGFNGINVSKKRYADGGSGVPPRGRPV